MKSNRRKHFPKERGNWKVKNNHPVGQTKRRWKLLCVSNLGAALLIETHIRMWNEPVTHSLISNFWSGYLHPFLSLFPSLILSTFLLWIFLVVNVCINQSVMNFNTFIVLFDVDDRKIERKHFLVGILRTVSFSLPLPIFVSPYFFTDNPINTSHTRQYAHIFMFIFLNLPHIMLITAILNR